MFNITYNPNNSDDRKKLNERNRQLQPQLINDQAGMLERIEGNRNSFFGVVGSSSNTSSHIGNHGAIGL
jgi:hypothetical protein